MALKSFAHYGIISLSLLAVSCSQGPTRIASNYSKSSNAEAEDESGDKKKPRPVSVPKGNDGDILGEEEAQDKPVDKGPEEIVETTDPPVVIPPVVTPIPMPPAIIDQPPSTHLEAAFIRSFLDEIAGPKGAGRGTGSPENKAVAETIAAEFKNLGFKPGGDNGSYFQAFSAKGKATQNIIGILPGEIDEYIVMGAHMDHLGTTNGKVYYGADDNASGTTGLVANARAFAKNTAKLKRGIIFIAFSGEEMGLLGSIHYVKYPTVDIKKVKFMVNTDMIGRYNGEMEILGVEKSIEGNSITRELMGKTNLKAKFLAEVSAGGSDHMPFKQIGIPTATFHTALHKEYHQPTDTIEKIDQASLKTIAGVAADLAYRLAKSDGITAGSFSLVPIEVDGYSDGIHSHAGCEPGLATLEEVQSNLSSLKPLQ